MVESSEPSNFVLTLHIGGSPISGIVADQALAELAFLDAAAAPSDPGTLAFHCLVTAASDSEAIAYAAGRAITALVAAGVDAPVLEGVDISVIDAVLV